MLRAQAIADALNRFADEGLVGRVKRWRAHYGMAIEGTDQLTSLGVSLELGQVLDAAGQR